MKSQLQKLQLIKLKEPNLTRVFDKRAAEKSADEEDVRYVPSGRWRLKAA